MFEFVQKMGYTQNQRSTLTVFTPIVLFRVIHEPHIDVFGMWEEAREHADSSQDCNRIDSNEGHLECEADVLVTCFGVFSTTSVLMSRERRFSYRNLYRAAWTVTCKPLVYIMFYL